MIAHPSTHPNCHTGHRVARLTWIWKLVPVVWKVQAGLACTTGGCTITQRKRAKSEIHKEHP